MLLKIDKLFLVDVDEPLHVIKSQRAWMFDKRVNTH